MRQSLYGLIVLLLLALPPMRTLLESYMAFHMHMQMMLLFISGVMMAPLFQRYLPKLFNHFNRTGIPGVILCLIIIIYWMIPRTMDEALEIWYIELFKFVSLPLFAGVAIRDSWMKIKEFGQVVVLAIIGIIFSVMTYLYIFSESTLCNNYLMVDQKTVGWGFLFFVLCIVMYLILMLFTDQKQYFIQDKE